MSQGCCWFLTLDRQGRAGKGLVLSGKDAHFFGKVLIFRRHQDAPIMTRTKKRYPAFAQGFLGDRRCGPSFLCVILFTALPTSPQVRCDPGAGVLGSEDCALPLTSNFSPSALDTPL